VISAFRAYQDKNSIYKQKAGHAQWLLSGILQLILALVPVIIWAQSSGNSEPAALMTVNLKVNERSSLAGMAVGARLPRFSWEVKTNQPAGTVNHGSARVSAYQILVGQLSDLKSVMGQTNKKKVGKWLNSNEDLYWNSFKQTKGDLFHTIYNGKKQLQSDRIYYWMVRVWDEKGRPGKWSQVDSFQTALFERKDFAGARWIGRNQMLPEERILPGDTAVIVTSSDGKKKKLPFGSVADTLPLFRKSFDLFGKASQIQRATLYVSGLGQLEARLNGQKIGDHFLDPGWTNYQKVALYVALDVTKLLKDSENVLGVELGNGFYYIPGSKDWYKKLLVQYGFPKMICRLSIHYKDGRSQNVVSNTSWQSGVSATWFSSIYGGELEDGTKQATGWDKPGFDPAKKGWKAAITVIDTPTGLTLQKTDPIKVMEKFSAKAIYPVKPANGQGEATDNWLYDMGQNCSGIPYMELSGKKGDTVTLLPAELMTARYAANQKATGKYRLIYVLEKDGLQSWHPKFTYYGFRYIQLKGAVPKGKPNPNGKPVVKLMETWHIRNSAPEAGHFSCSSDLFNKTSELIRWAIKSNMMSLFTDCPHREKLGWLEQLHLMGSSVRYNYQIHHLLTKSLSDMRAAQTKDGLIPEIAPEYTVFTWGGDMFRDSPEWGSSAIIVPWYLYSWYGDSSALKDNYAMMARYHNYLKGKAKNHILYQGLGDWYDLGPKPPGTSQLTPKGLTATAIYYYDLGILSNTAQLLDKQTDRQEFIQEAAQVKSAFNQQFLHEGTDSAGGKTAYYGAGSQTADAMALYMDLVPDHLHDLVVHHLVTGIIQNNYRLTAGDIGYRYLLRVLEAEGYNDLIFKMNNRSDVPGYGYQIAHGATALTESWQALPSVSNNHFMLGHLMEWFYSGLLGIRLDFASKEHPGHPYLVIAPEMVGGLSWAKGDYMTPYGQVKVYWQKHKEAIELRLQVPVGLTAEVRLPYQKQTALTTKKQKKDSENAPVQIKTVHGKKYFVTMASSGDHIYKLQPKHSSINWLNK
jgi:hypothetical protein